MNIFNLELQKNRILTREIKRNELNLFKRGDTIYYKNNLWTFVEKYPTYISIIRPITTHEGGRTNMNFHLNFEEFVRDARIPTQTT